MENFLLIFIFVGLGILFKRLKAFPDSSAQVLNMFALYVSLPALVLLKIPQLKLGADELVVVAIPWALLLVSVIIVLVFTRKFGWSRSRTGVLLLLVPIGNTSFLGVPMVNAFFGPAGLPYLVVYDQAGTMLIFLLYGSMILALYGKEGAISVASVCKRLVCFPPAIAAVVGLLLRPWPYPAAVTAALDGIAQSLIPLVMTAIGLQLHWRLNRSLLAPLSFGLGLKLLVAPLLALLVCRLLGLSGLSVNVAIIEAGMPPMVIASALAVIAGMDGELAVGMVGIGIVCSFVTLPLVFLLL